ncbi:Membrane protein involved in the export of O-antigen and teichoic acid [Pseudoalteromonas denitrificans DSM 6059]|uniref:Membrane protein involved in the export of O-antigen and teichoic acid n=2 Tax=Pseudoalteromonas TaxID=53246 RepID=A0A1I1EQN1_9GAMM|nr:Membrane protein involved in the export of O-antigen and teichoic acid [Pseudoalteromonas denitrificans DSM 6059]
MFIEKHTKRVIKGKRMIKGIKIHQAIYYGLGILLMKSVSLIMLPIVTFYLSPAQYGALELMLSFSNFATLIVGFGLVDGLYRFVGMNEDPLDENMIIANFITLALIIGLVSLAIGMSLAPFIVMFLTAGITLFDMQLLVIMFSFEGCIAIPLAWLRMREQASSFFLLTTSKVIIQACISWFLLRQGLGISAILWGGLISILLLAVTLLFMQIRETGLNLNFKLVPQILSYGYPLVLSSLAAFALNGADWWMVAAVSSEHELGLYSLAKKLATISIILIQPFCMWWFARRFEELKKANGLEVVANKTSLGLALVLCFATLICLSSPIAINYFIDSNYQNAIIYIPWLLTFFVIKQAAELINMGCYIKKSTKNVMYIDFATAIIAVMLCYLLSEYFQVFGVILSLILAQTFRVVTFFIISQRTLELKYDWNKLLLLSIICVLFLIIIPNVINLYLQLLLIIVALLVMSAFLYLSGLFTAKESISKNKLLMKLSLRA